MFITRQCSSEDDNPGFGDLYRFCRHLSLSAGIVLLFGTQTLAQSSDLTTTRAGHAATLLASGKVLITGGVDETGKTQTSAELYDPATRTSTKTGGMANARERHTSTLLTDGTVLIAGAEQNGNPLSTAEIYDPKTGQFTLTKTMHALHTQHIATRLREGNLRMLRGSGAERCSFGIGPKFTETTGAPVVVRKE